MAKEVVSVVLLTFFCGCNLFKHQSSEVKSYTPQIVFLTYKVVKASNQERFVTLLNTMVVDGDLKYKDQRGAIDDYLCFQLDGKDKILDSVYISNPLEKSVEFVDENGLLARKFISLDSAEFTIRMSLHTSTKSVLISGGSINKQPLLKSKL